jgi:hypothetical protein
VLSFRELRAGRGKRGPDEVVLAPRVAAVKRVDNMLTVSLVLKLNSDQNPVASSRHKIRSIPPLRLFCKGQAIDRQIGGAGNAELADWFDARLPTRRTYLLVWQAGPRPGTPAGYRPGQPTSEPACSYAAAR